MSFDKILENFGYGDYIAGIGGNGTAIDCNCNSYELNKLIQSKE